MKQIKRQLPKQELRSAVTQSVNEESRTVELTWTTGAKGLRSYWGEKYYEELSLDPNHVDMTRLKEGAPLLAAHNDYSLDAVIGVVERAWLEGNEGKAVVRFAKDEFSERIYQKVKDRVLRNVSVGYSVQEYTNVTEQGEEIPTYRATRWQPAEISIVPIGFDAGARTRNNEQLTENEVLINTRSVSVKEEIMPPENKETSVVDTEALKKEAAEQERKRATSIRNMVRDAKLEETVADELIARGLSEDQAKNTVDLISRSLKKSEETKVTSHTPSIEVGQTDEQKKRQGFEEALLVRIDSQNFKPTEASRLFLGKSLLRGMELIIPRNAMESDSQYAKRAMSSSDLPLALANVAEKSLQKVYELQPRTYKQWTRKDSLRNYKEHSQVKSGDFGSLQERKEGGEFQLASFGEKNEVAQLKDYGVKHAFTSQMLVNDDMSVISRLTSGAGIAVARLENSKAYSALTTNKNMKDGVALYHSNHGNLGTTGAINATTIAEIYKLMRKQTSTDGRDKLNLAPKYLICGPDKESEARQFFAAVNATQTSNVNIYSGRMEIIVDAEITGNQFYALADQNIIDTVVCYHLEGQEAPQIESRVNWDTNSLELKVAHAFAAEPMDWRGIVKNAGA